MVGLKQALEVAANESDRFKVLAVLEDILDYATGEADEELMEDTLNIIEVIKEEN